MPNLKPPLLSADERRDTYWYPFHPRLRWVIFTIGLLSIGFGVLELMRGNGFKVSSWGIGIWMFFSSFHKPVLKHKSWLEIHLVSLLIGLILVVAAFLLLFAGYTWIRF